MGGTKHYCYFTEEQIREIDDLLNKEFVSLDAERKESAHYDACSLSFYKLALFNEHRAEIYRTMLLPFTMNKDTTGVLIDEQDHEVLLDIVQKHTASTALVEALRNTG